MNTSRRRLQLFLNGARATFSLGTAFNWQCVCMGVWWIAWLGTLAAGRLTDGKLNSRQMPLCPLCPLPPAYPLHKLNARPLILSVSWDVLHSGLLSLHSFCPVLSSVRHPFQSCCLKLWPLVFFWQPVSNIRNIKAALEAIWFPMCKIVYCI